MNRYVRIRSWHLIRRFTLSGFAMTRCGQRVAVAGASGATTVQPMAENLPIGEASCESCLRLALHDGEIPTPAAPGGEDA